MQLKPSKGIEIEGFNTGNTRTILDRYTQASSTEPKSRVYSGIVVQAGLIDMKGLRVFVQRKLYYMHPPRPVVGACMTTLTLPFPPLDWSSSASSSRLRFLLFLPPCVSFFMTGLFFFGFLAGGSSSKWSLSNSSTSSVSSASEAANSECSSEGARDERLTRFRGGGLAVLRGFRAVEGMVEVVDV